LQGREPCDQSAFAQSVLFELPANPDLEGDAMPDETRGAQDPQTGDGARCAKRRHLIRSHPRARRSTLVTCASVLALLVSVATLLATTAPVAPAASARAARTPRCATSGLVMWLNAEGSGTAGSFYYKIEFANLSGRTCTLAGYPGVSAVNLRGRQIGSPASREVTQRPSVVTLAPEAQTTAIVRVIDVGALPASCRPATAAGFRVYPPGQSTSKLVPFPFRTCSKVGQSSMSVRAVKSE
jgi:hypothetical protein